MFPNFSKAFDFTLDYNKPIYIYPKIIDNYGYIFQKPYFMKFQVSLLDA